MAKIFFDKGTKNAKELAVDYIDEQLSENTMTISKNTDLSAGSPIDDFGEFVGYKFEAVNAETDGGVEIPINGTYTKISFIRTSYSEQSKNYSMNMTII